MNTWLNPCSYSHSETEPRLDQRWISAALLFEDFSMSCVAKLRDWTAEQLRNCITKPDSIVVFQRCPFQPWCAANCLGSNQKVIFIADKKERDRKPMNFTSCGFLGLCQTPTVDSFPSAITTALTWISQHFWNSPPVRLQSVPSKYFQDYRSPPCPASKTSCRPLWGRYYDHVPRVWGAFCFEGVV